MVKRILVTRRRAAQTQIVTNGKVDTEGKQRIFGFRLHSMTPKAQSNSCTILFLISKAGQNIFKKKAVIFAL
jgi:hypothetical protein